MHPGRPADLAVYVLAPCVQRPCFRSSSGLYSIPAGSKKSRESCSCRLSSVNSTEFFLVASWGAKSGRVRLSRTVSSIVLPRPRCNIAIAGALHKSRNSASTWFLELEHNMMHTDRCPWLETHCYKIAKHLNEREASKEASIAQHPRRIPGFNPFRLLTRSHALTLLLPQLQQPNTKGWALDCARHMAVPGFERAS